MNAKNVTAAKPKVGGAIWCAPLGAGWKHLQLDRHP